MTPRPEGEMNTPDERPAPRPIRPHTPGDAAGYAAHAKQPTLPGATGGGRKHEWNKDGERCVRCGLKDWMGGPCTPPASAPGGEVELLRFKFETPVEVFYAEFEKRTGCVDDLCDVLGHDDAVACLDAAITAAVRRAAEQGQREALKWAEKHHPIWVDRFDGEAGEVVQRETVEEYVTRGLAALADGDTHNPKGDV